MQQTAATAAFDVDFDSLNNLEERAYRDGFQQGHEHGELHGTFEGRELGRDKGYEVWEEVGFYGGMARTWRSLIEASGPADKLSRKQVKQLQHLHSLEQHVAAFPLHNTSSDAADEAAFAASAGDDSDDTTAAHARSDAGQVASDLDDDAAQDLDEDLSKLDVLALLERIRARYRLTCSVLGVRPRGSATAPGQQERPGLNDSAGKVVLVAGKMVDPTQLGY